MVDATPNVPRLLEWDSEFFGLRIASLSALALGEGAWRSALDWAGKERIDCLYLLSESDDSTSRRLFEHSGAALVDLRVTLARDTGPMFKVKPCSATLRAANANDVSALRAIASRAHTDSRFYSDGRFARERCDELYATWIERSVRGWARSVLVAELDGALAGYVTLHARPDGDAEIGLIAVTESARGKGVGRFLVESALLMANAFGLAHTSVVTQGSSVAAQRLYQSAGFRTTRVQLWHHLWFEKQAPTRA